jgi:CheY-like chemotaxis protein
MKRILVIEDDRIMRENIAEMLELSGYSVKTAPNGKIGVELARDILPDLILCDIMMPVLDGYGVIHILSREADTAAIPFIFLTARTELSDLRKGMNLGADDYLMKPFEDSELLNAVETRLKKKYAITGADKGNVQYQHSFSSTTIITDIIREMALGSKKIRIRKRGVIYRPEDHPAFIFYVESGRVKTYLLNENGKELISGIFMEGDIFGYQAAIEGRNYREFAAAVDDLDLRRIPIGQFNDLYKKDPAFAEGMLRMVSSDLTEKEGELLQMAYASVRKRLAIKLIELAEESAEDVIEISRNDIASMLGTSNETIVRSLAELREMNLISADHTRIKITDRDRLVNLSRSW